MEVNTPKFRKRLFGNLYALTYLKSEAILDLPQISIDNSKQIGQKFPSTY